MFKLNGEKTCQGISGKRTAFGSGSKTRRRLICDEHAHSTQLTRTVHDLAMDRTFKRTFLMTGAIAQDRERCQIFADGWKTHCCAGQLGRRAVRTGMKGSLGCRSPELRASGAVGLRWQAAFGSSDCLE